MATPNLPPSGITPSAFFEEWLPAEYARLRPELAATPPDAVISVELSGDQGGAWTLSLVGGALSVAAAPAESANIAVRQSVDDWRLITIQAASHGADPAAAASIEKLLTSPALGQLMNDIKGTVRFQIPGLAGRDFGAEIVFGGAADPNATVTVGADTLEQIRSGAMPAPQAYFSGLIKVDGDPTLFMQVSMAFFMS